MRCGRKIGLAACFVLLGSQGLQNANAVGDTRTISLLHIHTKEDLTITYKKDGRYDEDALKKINWIMRDWRKEQDVKMDPHAIDLLWEVQHEVGAKSPIHIVCGYRSPATNNMLRRRSKGVAQVSQHMVGKAIDFFIPGVQEFKRMAAAGDFLEHARVFDNYYATPRRPVEKALAEGQDLILEIDWQGAAQVRAAMPESVSIFVLPPSRAELERRLRARGTDTGQVIQRRLADAAADMTHWREFDYVVVNDDFERATAELADIVRGGGEKARSSRPGLAEFVSKLTGEPSPG